MWILLTLALAASEGGLAKVAVPPGGGRLTPAQESWFGQRAKGFGSSVRLAPIAPAETPPFSGRSATPADPSAMECTIRVLKVDPAFDAKIAQPGPKDLDPKIVRPSPCLANAGK